jgi:adenylate cyclase class 2
MDDRPMLEVEVKARVDALDIIEERLQDMGFSLSASEEHSDVYLNHPARDFASTDEALRLRSVRSGDVERTVMTYKGPKLDSTTKTREEVNVTVKGDALSLLRLNGYTAVLTVKKSRRVYRKKDIEVCLDTVPGLGTFVEIECQSHELEEARARVMALAKELGLEDLERRSYLELLLEKQV